VVFLATGLVEWVSQAKKTTSVIFSLKKTLYGLLSENHPSTPRTGYVLEGPEMCKSCFCICLPDKVTRIGGDEPAYYSDQTEAVGQCVKSVLQRDPRRFVDISRRLHGRQLPGSLRSYMWLDVLFKTDRERLKEG
jgi:hypothetical protein